MSPRRVLPALSARPIVTLTSDFGMSDAYVATMKAGILRECPAARLIDVTHFVPRHDILCGSITLERAVDGFPPRTVHLAVIDPGVGTDRRMLIAEVNQQLIVCPDNGLITWSWRIHGDGTVREITWRPAKCSATFHGRDIMGPVAGKLAQGVDPREISREMREPILLDNLAPASGTTGRIIHIDHFGNATTNVPLARLKDRAGVSIKVKGRSIGKLKKTYWDVAPGKPLALIGSSGLLEVAVRDGSAAEALKVKVGDRVQLG